MRLVVAVGVGFVALVVSMTACIYLAFSLGLNDGAVAVVGLLPPFVIAAFAVSRVMRALEERADRAIVAQLSGDGTLALPASPSATDGYHEEHEAEVETEDAEAENDGEGAEDEWEDEDAEERAQEPSPVTPEVIAALMSLEGPGGGMAHTLAILGFSAFLFMTAEATLSGSLTFILHLVAVLAIHEAGHWVAMRAFGYRDLKVFFIPFLGAAVSGRRHEATGVQRAIVSLAGPIPSLVLALVLAIGSGFGWNVDLDFVGLMLALNALNLLPFEPLDGGRFLNVVVYHRHPRAESVMRALGALAIVGAALAWEDWILGVFGAFFALGLGHSARVAVAARSFRERLAPGDLASPTIPVERYDQLARIARDEVLRSGSVPAQPKMLATTMQGIWEKAGIQSPSALASLLLLSFYLTTVAGLVLMFVTGAS